MDLFQLWGNVGIKTANAMKDLNNFENEVQGTAGRVGQSTGAVGNGFDQMSNKFSNMGQQMTTTGAAASIAVSAPLTALGAQAIKIVSSFDDVMSTVKAVTGATGDDFDQLRETAKRLGAETRFSSSEAAEGMQYLGMAGWDTQKILEGIPHMLNLASAGGLDLGRAADIASDTMAAFGIEASDAGHMADVFAKAASSTNTSVEMLGETMKYASPIAATFGASLEETTALAGLMADKGIKASMSGTAIRGGLTRMAAPTKQAEAYMRQLGITFTNADGSMRDMNDIIRDLSVGMGKLTEEQQLGAAKAIFGQEAMAGWLAVIESGPDKFDEFTKKLEKSSEGIGAASEMAKTREDNIGGAFREMSSAIEGVAIEIGDVLAPAVRKAAVIIGDMATWFTKLPQGAKTATVALGVLAVAFGPIMVAMGVMMQMSGVVFGSFSKLFNLFASAPRKLLGAAKGLRGVGAAAQAAGAAAGGKGQVDAPGGGKVGPCPPGVGPGKAKKGKAGVGGCPGACMGCGAAGVGGGKNKKGKKGKGTPGSTTPDVPISGAGAGKGAGKGAAKGASGAVTKGVGATLKKVGLMVARAGATLLPMLLGPVGLAITAIVAVIAGGVYLAIKHWDKVKNAAKIAFDGITSFVKQWGPTLLSVIMGPIGMLVGLFVKNFGAIKENTIQAFNLISNGIKAFMNAIKSFLAGILANLVSLFVSSWNTIKNFLNTVMTAINTLIRVVWNGIKTFLTTIMNSIKTVITSAWNAIKSVVTSVVNSIKTTITSVFNTIKNTVSTAITATKNAVVGAFNAMWNTAKTAATGIKNSIIGAFDSIKNLASDAWGWGADIISGLIGGIKGGVKNVTGAIGDVASSLSKKFTKALGIKSPSRLFRGFGLNIGQGLAIGIDKTRGIIQRASELMNHAIIRPEGVEVPISTKVANKPKNPVPQGTPGPNGTTGGNGNNGVVIQNAQFTIKVDKIQTEEDVKKMRRAIQTVVSDDLFDMAVRNV